MSVSLYTSRVILDVLGIEDFGIYNIVGGVVAIFSFLQGSLSGATSRFLTYEHGTKNREKLNIVFSNALTAHIVLTLVVIIFAETIGLWFVTNKLIIPENRMSVALIVYQLSIISAAISILVVPYNASVIANEKMGIYAWISIAQSLMRLGIVFLLSLSSFDKLVVYASLLLAVSIIIGFIYFFYCRFLFPECKSKLSIEKEMLKPLLLFSSWDLYGNVSVIARGQGVNILHNLFFGIIINAAGGVATQVQNALETFANNFLLAIRPQITKTYASGNTKSMINLIISSSKLSFFLLLFISIPLIVENEFVLSIWLKKTPEYAVSFTQLCILFSLISMIFRPIVFAVHATGRVGRMSFCNGTIYLLVLPITYILFQQGYSPIVPYALNIFLMLIAGFINLSTFKIYVPDFSVSNFIKKSVLVCFGIGISSTIFPIIVYYTMETNGWLRFILVGLSSSISVFLLVYFWGIDQNIRSVINSKIINLRKKKK